MVIINLIVGKEVLRMEWMGVACALAGVFLSLLDTKAQRVESVEN